METVPKWPERLQKRGHRFYCRARVPKDLVEVLGKREVVRALRTGDFKEAVERVRLASAEVDAEFAAARRRATATPPPLTETEVRRMVLLWFRRVDRGAADADFSVHGRPALREALEAVGFDEAVLTGAPGEEVMPSVQAEADAILIHHGWGARPHRVGEMKTGVPVADIDKTSPGYALLCKYVHRGMVEAARRSRQRLRGEPAAAADPLFAEARADAPEAPAPPGITFGELVGRYMADPGRAHLTPKTVADYDAGFRTLKELVGADRPVRSITREDCRAARDLLVRLPPHARKRFPRLALRQAAEAAQARALKTLSPKSVNDLMGMLSTLFSWAVREGYADRNHAEALRVTAPASQRRAARLPFSPDQLRLIFGSPPYSDPEAPRDGLFWLPLISLFSGMRLGEIAQLSVDDVAKRDGTDVILVRPGEGKSLKTPAAARVVPVHPELRRIGFLRHVAGMRAAGEERLFPDLPRGRDGYHASVFQKRYSRHLRRVGAYTPQTTFHSFRHSATDALREAGVPPERIRAIMGWSGGGMEEQVYGSGHRARTLAKEVDKVRYPGLSLNHLHVK